MKKHALIVCALILLSLPLMAQIDLPKPNFSMMNAPRSPLFDVSKLKMSHSVGFEAGASSMGGFYLSRYTNHLKYSFNPKLDLKLDLSVINYGSSNAKFKLNDDNRSQFVPGFTLDYHPSDSFNIKVEYRQGMPLGSGSWYHQDPYRSWWDK
ncbi:MAG: hypothetical protein WBI94_05790 [Candidatus Cloacimonadaceae bacterium]|jgi:hypothetical protein